MALGYLDDSKLYAIASAIRSKTSKSATMTVDDMPDEIESITTGAVVEPLSVTANGTYTAPAGQGYTPVTVSVPTGGGDATWDEIAERTMAGVASGSASIIGSSAFCNCKNLTGASFPNATSIGGSAFASCSSLGTAYIPSAKEIGAGAFFGCSSLSEVNIQAATHIRSSAFQGCGALSSLTLSSVAYIYASAFRSCFMLTTLDLTGVSSLTALGGGSGAFTSTPILNYSASAGKYGSIYVPASLYSSFVNANGWSYFTPRFVSV